MTSSTPSIGDIYLTWNFETGYGDWSFENGDLQTGGGGILDLQTAVLISIFTDRVESTDYVPVDGTGDLRGWWADTYLQEPLGSRLWTLYRSKITSSTAPLLQARGFVQESLQWLLDDGIAASVTVQTFWNAPSVMGITVLITEPMTSANHKFNFSYAWQ